MIAESIDNIPSVTYTYGDDLISQRREETTHTYHYDGLGSARYLSNENGTFTDSYDYEAFGKLLNSEGNTTNSYKFTGEQYDEETKHYYLRARYYAPTMGSFTQMDTYEGSNGEPITLHKYLYANGDPVNNIDPTGNYSMASVTAAMEIRNTLQNMQLESYMNMTDVVSGGWDGVSLDNIPEIAATAVGLRLLMRFVPNFFKKGCNSFDAQTLVAAENGLIPIEDIRIGDKVWAYNEENQSKSLQEVTHLIRGEGNKELVDIKLSSGEIITATANHPFWAVNDSNWTNAVKLTTDTVLLDINEKNSTISSLRSYSQNTVVYNLTVANDHTYFVGSDGVLGHNAECPLGEFNLPSNVRSPKGVSGNFTIKKYSYRIDTNRIHPNEQFHIHIYEKNKEIAKIKANGGWLPMHGGKPLPASPSTVPKLLRKEINKLVNHVKLFL